MSPLISDPTNKPKKNTRIQVFISTNKSIENVKNDLFCVIKINYPIKIAQKMEFSECGLTGNGCRTISTQVDLDSYGPIRKQRLTLLRK